MTLDEVVADIERRFEVRPDSVISTALTGEPFVTIVSGGQKKEGDRCPVYCTSEEVAIDFWKKSVNEYAANKKGRLYWRERPICDEWVLGKSKFEGDIIVYNVYSRLLISNKPEVMK